MNKPAPLNRRVSVAPMMGWTDRHDRYFLRLISPSTLLYSVMITTGALVHGKKYEILEFSEEEHPVALQLGGSDPDELAQSALLGQKYGYDEINLNCGCPSERVQKGQFGACLMAEPALVAACVAAMKNAVSIPVTVKTRIGIDDQDSYEFVRDFVGIVSEKGGCDSFTIHARKAILGGLSPAENRTIPPLKYETAYRLKRDFPHLEIILNGGIKTVADIQSHLPHVDGVMIGREAYSNPYLLAAIERDIFGAASVPTRAEVLDALMPYVDRMLSQGVALKDITRHILGLFQGQPGGRKWRRVLSEDAYRPGAGPEVIHKALREVSGG